MYALMAEMGVGVNDEMLTAVSASDVYLRSCANLVNQQYRQGAASCRGAPSNDRQLCHRAPGLRRSSLGQPVVLPGSPGGACQRQDVNALMRRLVKL